MQVTVAHTKFHLETHLDTTANPNLSLGKLLEALKRLLGNLKSLKHLELIDLILDPQEALRLLDQVCYNQTKTMRRLKLVNCTKTPCQLLHVGVFVNLQVHQNFIRRNCKNHPLQLFIYKLTKTGGLLIWPIQCGSVNLSRYIEQYIHATTLQTT